MRELIIWALAIPTVLFIIAVIYACMIVASDNSPDRRDKK